MAHDQFTEAQETAIYTLINELVSPAGGLNYINEYRMRALLDSIARLFNCCVIAKQRSNIKSSTEEVLLAIHALENIGKEPTLEDIMRITRRERRTVRKTLIEAGLYDVSKNAIIKPKGWDFLFDEQTALNAIPEPDESYWDALSTTEEISGEEGFGLQEP